MRVLDAVAEEIGVEPMDLETPLYRVVDPDALERLLGSAVDLTITFEYHQYAVAVTSDGTVRVDEAPVGTDESA